ncbi:hydrolase [Mesobacillus zeae]|uniref:Hydrolase n=1 Tax=Mesobacillus zeae TaxID=1917180 RepID=A0A398AWP3_9BACI|nr:hydrolase [Mesobacillus zeae]RID82015.1 hydrolase [Mesobacillus zeae]
MSNQISKCCHGSSSRRRNRCNKCVCDILRRLRTRTEVDVFLSGGVVLEDVIFVDFDNRNCCATFRDEEDERGTIIFVDCRDIQALRVE